MVLKDKVIKLYSLIETKEDGEDGELHITGHASTNSEDRSGDVIVSEAWNKAGALTNYLKNPIVLAYHDMSKPIGKTIGHEVDDKGLKITAKISKAAGDILGLIKEGILSAFSVGFIVKDADYDSKHGIFVIQEVELLEVSVVSIPANQDALFSIEKNFPDSEQYVEFKKQFIKESEETLMVDKTDKGSNPIDVAALVAEITSAVKSDIKTRDAEEAAKQAAEKKAAENMEAIATTAAERLVKDLDEKLAEKDANLSEMLTGLHDQIKAMAEKGELKEVFDAKNKGKMEYNEDKGTRFEKLDTNTRDGIMYASKLLGIPATETKTFKDFVKKSGMEHWDSGVTGEWEDEYSTRVQNAMREQLVVESLFTSIPMSTPTMNMPINPEAGDATWVHESAYRSDTAPWAETGDGSDTSTGTAVDHEIDEQTLIARKLATREYIGYEEEEDSIVALAPIINDAVARRMARTSDLAYLRGTGFLSNSVAYDPILGLEGRGAGTTDLTIAGSASWAANVAEDDVADMRKNLGLYGLDPSQLVLLVSHDYYYELMKLDNFKTDDLAGIDRATLRTGQVGSIFGVTVLVSQMFDNAAIVTGTTGTTLAIMVRPSNFITGVLRGITTEADKDVINQKRVIVSSRRFAFNDIITGEATVNLQITS